MSLVNDMLTDLERRRAHQPPVALSLAGFSTHRVTPFSSRLIWWWAVALLVLVTILVYLYLRPATEQIAQSPNPIEVAAAPPAVLSKIEWLDGADSPALQLRFNTTPDYRLTQNGQQLLISLSPQNQVPVFTANALVKSMESTIDDERLVLSFELAANLQTSAELRSGSPAVLLLRLNKASPAALRASNQPSTSAAVVQAESTAQVQTQAQPQAQPQTLPVVATERKPSPSVAVSPDSTRSELSGIKKSSVSLTSAQRDQINYEQASGYLKQGDIQAARQLLATFVNSDSGALKSAVLYASILTQLQQYSQAQLVLGQLAERAVPNLDHVMVQARLWLMTGQVEQAEKLMAQFNPGLTERLDYYELQALVAQRSGNFALSAQLYSNLLQLDSSVGDWWVGLAIAQELQGQKGSAQDSYRRALTLTRLSTTLRDYARQRLDRLES